MIRHQFRSTYLNAAKIISFMEGKARKQLAEDEMLQLAIVRLVEIIGEASTRWEKTFRVMTRADL